MLDQDIGAKIDFMWMEIHRSFPNHPSPIKMDSEFTVDRGNSLASSPQHQSSTDEQNTPKSDRSVSATKQPPVMLVETAFLASTASLLWLINYYFPLGPVFKIFFPIPIALIYLRWGKRAGLMTALVSGLLLSVLMGPTRSILFLIPYAIIGVQLGAFWRRGSSWLSSIGVGALLDCLGVFFRLWLTSILLGEDLWIYLMARIRDIAEWIFVQLGILAEPSLLVIQILALCLILISNFVYLFVIHLVALLMFERLRTPIPKPPAWVETLLEI
jgi:uncharacterized protein YybS (DUF2232 family)